MPIELPEDLVEIAEKELNETPTNRAKGLSELKALIAKMKQTPSRTDDDYLLRYLRWSKFNAKKAFTKYANMEKFLRANADTLKDIDPAEFKEIYAMGFMRLLSGRDKGGAIVSCLLPARMGKVDPVAYIRWSVWAMEAVADDPYLQVNGMVIIENFESFTMMQMARMQSIPTRTMMKMFHFSQSCSPYRLKGIYVFNQPSFMSFLWALVRPFMSKKMIQRVRFFGGNLKACEELIDPAVLPVEFGGALQEDPMAWLDLQIAKYNSKQEQPPEPPAAPEPMQ